MHVTPPHTHTYTSGFLDKNLFQEFFFAFSFKQFDYDVSRCRFLWVYLFYPFFSLLFRSLIFIALPSRSLTLSSAISILSLKPSGELLNLVIVFFIFLVIVFFSSFHKWNSSISLLRLAIFPFISRVSLGYFYNSYFKVFVRLFQHLCHFIIGVS